MNNGMGCVSGLGLAALALALEDGAEGGIRTHDRRFTKPMLYP